MARRPLASEVMQVHRICEDRDVEGDCEVEETAIDAHDVFLSAVVQICPATGADADEGQGEIWFREEAGTAGKFPLEAFG